MTDMVDIAASASGVAVVADDVPQVVARFAIGCGSFGLCYSRYGWCCAGECFANVCAVCGSMRTL